MIIVINNRAMKRPYLALDLSNGRSSYAYEDTIEKALNGEFVVDHYLTIVLLDSDKYTVVYPEQFNGLRFDHFYHSLAQNYPELLI